MVSASNKPGQEAALPASGRSGSPFFLLPGNTRAGGGLERRAGLMKFRAAPPMARDRPGVHSLAAGDAAAAAFAIRRPPAQRRPEPRWAGCYVREADLCGTQAWQPDVPGVYLR